MSELNSIRKDKKGVTGLPLRLLVYMVAVAIGVPIIWSGAQAYSRKQTESKIENEVNFIKTIIKNVYMRGENNSRIIEVNLPDPFFSNLRWVKIGGQEGDSWSKLSTIRYKMSYSSSKTITISDPNIPVISSGDTLKLSSGSYRLYIECIMDEDFDKASRLVKVLEK